MGITSLSQAVPETQGALVLVAKQDFTAQSSVSLDNVFTSTYDNYSLLVVFSAASGTGVSVAMRMRAASTDATGASDYKFQISTSYGASTSSSLTTSSNFPDPGYISTTYGDRSSFTMDVLNPALAAYTGITGIRRAADASFTYTSTFTGTHLQSVAYDGITLYPSSGTITGTVYVYGYSKVVNDPVAVNREAANGLVLVATSSFSAASSVSVDGCFTSTYQNYMVVMSGTISVADNVQFRLRVGGADNSTASSYVTQLVQGAGATVAASRTSQSFAYLYTWDTTLINTMSMMMFSPAVAAATGWQMVNVYSASGAAPYYNTGTHNQTTAYDGITFYPAGGTLTGTLRVYGYRNNL